MKFLLYSNLWVAICAANFSLISSKLFHTKPAWLLLFGGTLALYGFHRMYKLLVLKELGGQEKERWLKNNLRLQLFLSLVGALVCCYEAFILKLYSSTTIILTVFCLALALFYVIRMRRKNIREMAYLKLFVVALTYVLFTSVLVYPEMPVEAFWDYKFTLLGLFLTVIGITLLFDLRDIHIDVNIRTFPKLLGEFNSKLISLALTVAGLSVLLYQHQQIWPTIVPASVFLSVAFFLLFQNKIQEWHYVFLFEGSLGALGLGYWLIA